MNYETARKAMIDSQLRTSGVNEPFVLSRMGAVAREAFLPEGKRAIAYMDRSIALENGVLASPVAHGKMLTEARPRPSDRALVIENGTGYFAELLRPVVAEIDTARADELPSGKSYDLVVVDGAIEDAPGKLAKLVAQEGRIVTGLVRNGITRLAIGKRSGDGLAFDSIADIALPVLAAFARRKEWSF